MYLYATLKYTKYEFLIMLEVESRGRICRSFDYVEIDCQQNVYLAMLS